MRKNALPIGILFMVLVVLLAGIGISYGWWTDAITVESTVNTGHLNVYWTGVQGDTNCSVGGSTADIAKVAVNNAYPGFECTVILPIKNDSSMSVWVDPYWTAATVSGPNPNLINNDHVLIEFDETVCDFGPGSDHVLFAPNERKDCPVTISIDEDMTGFQDASATYTLTLDAYQENGPNPQD